jgi:hypothetical protein
MIVGINLINLTCKGVRVGKKPWNPTRPTNPADPLARPSVREYIYGRIRIQIF